MERGYKRFLIESLSYSFNDDGIDEEPKFDSVKIRKAREVISMIDLAGETDEKEDDYSDILDPECHEYFVINREIDQGEWPLGDSDFYLYGIGYVLSLYRTEWIDIVVTNEEYKKRDVYYIDMVYNMSQKNFLMREIHNVNGERNEVQKNFNTIDEMMSFIDGRVEIPHLRESFLEVIRMFNNKTRF